MRYAATASGGEFDDDEVVGDALEDDAAAAAPALLEIIFRDPAIYGLVSWILKGARNSWIATLIARGHRRELFARFLAAFTHRTLVLSVEV